MPVPPGPPARPRGAPARRRLRSIGVSPELKGAHVFRQLGLNMETKYMQSLLKYGFIRYNQSDNKYYPEYFKNSVDDGYGVNLYNNQSLVIIQTDCSIP